MTDEPEDEPARPARVEPSAPTQGRLVLLLTITVVVLTGVVGFLLLTR